MNTPVRRRAVLGLTSASGVALLSVGAWAQCTAWVGRNGAPGLSTSGAVCVTTWDPDGAGPQLPQVVVGGNTTTAGNVPVNKVAGWNGSTWYAMGTNLNDTVRALTTWDPDGAGPLPPKLIAGGSFQLSGNRVAQWDGASWQPLGAGINNLVYALTSWDPDGDGPLLPLLIAAGVFDAVNGAPANRIAAWNGTSWQGLGSGMDGWVEDVRTLTTWDPDGPGGAPARLVAGGYFAAAGGVPAKNVAVWDGASWSALGAGLGVGADTNVTRITAWDPDGAGPLPERLIASGTFSASGATPLSRMAAWDGAAWQPFGAGLDAVANVLTTWDPDGDGPQPALLMAGGGQIFELPPSLWIKTWNGTAWAALGAMPSSTVGSAVVWDADGAGPQPPMPVIVGGFPDIGAARYNGAARWDGAVWQPLGEGLGGTISTLASWDPDGDGPLPEKMVAGGAISTLGGAVTGNVSAWNGAKWEPAGGGVNGGVASVLSWDVDGPGGQAPLLAVGGSFSSAQDVPAPGVAVWNGASWGGVGSGVPAGVRSMALYDADGDGPSPQTLVAVDVAAVVNGVFTQRIRRWTGTQWEPMGPNFTVLARSVARVARAGGDELYATVGSTVTRWDGAAWTQVGGALSNVNAMASWDPDGPGPLAARLVVGGDFFGTIAGVELSRIAQLDGGVWRPVGAGFNSNVTALAEWDLDGDGPQPAQLIAAGAFTQSGGAQCRYLARFDSGGGGTWLTLRTDAAQSIGALATLRRPVTGPGRDELFASMEGAHLVSSGAAPMIIAQPAAAEACAAGGAGGAVTLSATVLSAPTPTLRWQVQSPSQTTFWQDLADGPVVVQGNALGTVSGSGTATLTFTGPRFPGIEAIGLRLRASAPCGTVTSAEVPLWHDPADLGATGGGYGHDGVRDNNDFVAFIDAFFDGSTAADVGGTGGVRGADGALDNNDFVVFIELFFRAC